jgi:hypothetical protein
MKISRQLFSKTVRWINDKESVSENEQLRVVRVTGGKSYIKLYVIIGGGGNTLCNSLMGLLLDL